MDAEIANHLVGLYMREINRVELITAAKEQALASDIELGSHLERLELELVGGLGYDYGEDARAAGAPSTVLWEKAMVLLTPHRQRRTGGPGPGPSPGVGRRPHAGGGVPTSGVQGRHRRSDQPQAGGTACQGSGHYRGRRPRAYRGVVPGHPGAAGGGDHRRGDRENHRGRRKTCRRNPARFPASPSISSTRSWLPQPSLPPTIRRLLITLGKTSVRRWVRRNRGKSNRASPDRSLVY